MSAGVLRRMRWLLVAAVVLGGVAISQRDRGRGFPPVVASQTVSVAGAEFQVDFADGALDLSLDEIAERVRMAARAVVTYYGRFPVARVRLLVIPAAGGHGVMQGTTWGNRAGFPAFIRFRIGEKTTKEELAADWVMTHELVHTALPDLPDDQEWLEEGLASYVEPIARVQAGELSAARVWADMVSGMPHGEPEAGDEGLNVTHTWGRTYWGGSLFCLVADVEIRKETKNRKGLQDALRAVVAAGGSIDKDWTGERILSTGDAATGTHVLERMYREWGGKPVRVDLAGLWGDLGVKAGRDGVSLDDSAASANIRKTMTTVTPGVASLR